MFLPWAHDGLSMFIMIFMVIIDIMVYQCLPDLSSTSSSLIHHFFCHQIVIRLSWSCYVMSCWILDPWKSSGNLWPRRRRLSSSPSAPPARPISHRPSRRKLRTAFRLEPPHPMGQRHRKRRTTLVTVDDRFKDRCLEYLRISKVIIYTI